MPTWWTGPARRSSRSSTHSVPPVRLPVTTSACPGTTDRIWNAAQKLALHALQVFADYYANDALATVGYAFPTNPDRGQPIDSLAAPSQVDTVLAALADDLTAEHLDVALRDQDDRRKP